MVDETPEQQFLNAVRQGLKDQPVTKESTIKAIHNASQAHPKGHDAFNEKVDNLARARSTQR